jgi:hypothetical protein
MIDACAADLFAAIYTGTTRLRRVDLPGAGEIVAWQVRRS